MSFRRLLLSPRVGVSGCECRELDGVPREFRASPESGESGESGESRETGALADESGVVMPSGVGGGEASGGRESEVEGGES